MPEGTMSGELDELAAAAADVLVAALAGNSWEDARQWFATVIGHEGRLTATRAELTGAKGGPAWDTTVQAQVRAWTVRMRDILEDSPAAAQTLQELVAGMRGRGLPRPTAADAQPATSAAPSHL